MSEVMVSVENMRRLPLPTPEQHAAFITHLRSAHSWYKHLPLLTGGTFVVFLAPDAGCNYPSQHPCLPYGNTLAGYRRAFGYLDYMWRTDTLNFERDGSNPIELPQQMVQQCSFVLYPYVADEFYWCVHNEAIACLRSGIFHPAHALLLEWEAVVSEAERIASEPTKIMQLALLEDKASELHHELQAQESAKIEYCLNRLYKYCGK